MAKKVSGPQILTANLLSDGMVVFLVSDGTWRGSVENALIASSDDDVAKLEEGGTLAVQANLIVDPYLIAVEETDGRPVPVAFRERIRTSGPSIEFELNARAEGLAAYAG